MNILYFIQSASVYLMQAATLCGVIYFIILFVDTKGVFMRTLIVLYGLVVACLGQFVVNVMEAAMR
jgi:hypothetical protein